MISANQEWVEQALSPQLRQSDRTYALRMICCVALLASCLAILTASTLFTARLAAQPSNPFEAFVEVLPGVSTDPTFSKEFTCYPITNTFIELCTLAPATGPVEHVQLIRKYGTIYYTFFHLRENVLNLGELALLWGKPDVAPPQDETGLTWSRYDARVNLASGTGDVNYFLPVQSISFGESSIALIREF